MTVGTGGDYCVAIGDSITTGYGDDIATDDTSSTDGRSTGGGFPAVLNTLLAQAKGIPHTVVTEAAGDHQTTDGLNRLPAVLYRYPNAEFYLVLYGTNDSYETVNLYIGPIGFALLMSLE